MSIGSVTTTGLPDDSGLTRWDTGQLDYFLVGQHSGLQQSASLPCQQWGSVMLRTFATGEPYTVKLQWSIGDVLTFELDQTTYALDSGGSASLAITLPNRGTALVITTTPSVSPFFPFVAVVLTNRALPSATWQTAPELLFSAPALAAGANVAAFAAYVYGGQVRSHINGGSQGVTVEFDYLATDFTWRTLQVLTVAANANQDANLFFPIAPVRAIITNTSGVNANNTSTILLYPIAPSG